MDIGNEAEGRLSQCIDKSLGQLKNRDEVIYYPISQQDLITWTHCPLCQSDETSRISEVYLQHQLMFFSTDICNKCMHIFRGISPNTAWFKARWQQIATGEVCVYNPALEEKRKIRYELYYGILHKYKSSGLLLDIGAAYGSGTAIFLERGFTAEALEPEHDRAEYIKKIYGIPVHHCTLEEFKAPINKYEVIIFSHCLEHLDDPVNALLSLRDWLHDDGIMYIEIPIAWRVVDWQDSLFMAHKHNFIEKNLKVITEKTGFSIIDSYLIPDNDGPFCNLALIVVKDSQQKFKNSERLQNHVNLLDPPSFSIEHLKDLYRIQLPITHDHSSVIKISVPYINHFYHILRKDRNQCVLDNSYILYS